MAKFNPLLDLMPVDGSNSSEQSIDESQIIKTQLIETIQKTAGLVNLLKNKNKLLDKDLKKIKNLNRRLRTTIPRIPIMRGQASASFGIDSQQERERRGGMRFPTVPLIIPPKVKVASYKRKGLRKLLMGAYRTAQITSAINLAKNPRQITKILPKGFKVKIPNISPFFRKGRKIRKEFGVKNQPGIIKAIKSLGPKIKRFGSRIKNRLRNLFVKKKSTKIESGKFNYEKQKNLFDTIPSVKPTISPLLQQLKSGNVSKSKLYRTLGLEDPQTRLRFASYLEPANSGFQNKILKELGLIRGSSMKTPVSKDTFRFIMNAFKPSDFMLQQIKSGKMPTAIDSRINIFNKLKSAGYLKKLRLDDIVPKADLELLKKGLRLENIPLKPDPKQIEFLKNGKPLNLSSLNIDTGVTNTVIILTDPPIA